MDGLWILVDQCSGGRKERRQELPEVRDYKPTRAKMSAAIGAGQGQDTHREMAWPCLHPYFILITSAMGREGASVVSKLQMNMLPLSWI